MDIWLLHGVLACTALSIIFPLGIIRYWTKKGPCFVSHWSIQSFGVLVLIIAVAVGLSNSRGISQKHQFLGLLVAAGALIQQVLGVASKTVSSEHVSIAHAGLGFAILFVGWFTMTTGLKLAGNGSAPTTIFGVLCGIEIAASVAGSVIARKRQTRYSRLSSVGHSRSGPADEVFTLEAYDSEDEEEKAAGGTAGLGQKPMKTSSMRSHDVYA